VKEAIVVIEVDPIEKMGPWRLRKHLNLRHVPAGDFTDSVGENFFMKRSADHNNDAALRLYHERCHEMGTYDHEHS